jgi:NADPH:quinone reductase-like Zn-dependent oxidoreductase
MQTERPEKRATTMKAIRIHRFGGPEVLSCDTVPRPQAGTGKVLVKIKAAGVNPIDWKIRDGFVKELFKDRLPMIPGVDMAGIVESTGDGVRDFRKGDAVYGFLGSLDGGTYAEYVAANSEALAPMPRKLDFVQAAAIPLAAIVGWQTLFDDANLQPGQTVLIHGASGGVGHMAVQLAKWRGARVIGTASARNADFLKSIGCDRVIDYRMQRFEDVVDNIDVVLDTQAGDTQRRSYQVLKKGGIMISTLGIDDPELAAKYGVRARSFMAQPDGSELRQIARLVDEGKVRPEVSTVMPLKDAAKAHKLSETQHVRGKIVLKVSD